MVKGMLKKLLIIFMLIAVFNTSLISSFSNATALEHPYLNARYNGLNESQRLAIVNAGNYLQTYRFPFLIYCLSGLNNNVSINYKDEATNCNNKSKAQLMERYDQNAKLVPKIKTETKRNDIFITSCAYYCCYIYKNVLGLGGEEYSKYFSGSCCDWINILLRAKEDGDTNCPLEIVDGWNFDEIMPGDIIIYSDCNWDGRQFTRGTGTSGHAMLYLGKNGIKDSSKQNNQNAIAHASGHNVNIVTSYPDYENVTNPEGSTSGVRRCYSIRINPQFDISKLPENGNGLEIFDEEFGQYVPNALNDFMENGYLDKLNIDDSSNNAINYGQYSDTKSFGDQIIDTLSQVIDVILGFLLLPIKVIVIGWAGVIQKLVTTFISASTGVPSSDIITVEKIVYNQVPLLDANFFNLEQAGGEELTKDSVIYIIRSSISTWYNTIRGVGIVGMLVSLIYMGIRMAISSVSEEKAKYKKMLKDWVLSFVILMSMHYIMIIVVQINEQILTFLREGVASETSLYEQILIRAYDMRLSVGVPATAMYIVLVVFSALYFIAYLKRFFTLIILTIFSPIIAISYAIDKVKDGKSQSFSGWLKEYIYTVIMQSIHALLYVIFVSVSINMALGGMNVKPTGEVEADVAAINIVSAMGNLIPALVFMIVSLKLEDIFKSIFKIAPKGMDDVVASKEDALGYWYMAKNMKDKGETYLTKGLHYFAEKERAKDERLDINRTTANSSSGFFSTIEDTVNNAKWEASNVVDSVKTIATEVPKYVALKTLELPGLRGLYKIRHPFKYSGLKRYYQISQQTGRTVNSALADKEEHNRIKLQIKVKQIRDSIKMGNLAKDEVARTLANASILDRSKKVDKLIKKIATGKYDDKDDKTGAKAENAIRAELSKYSDVTTEEMNATINLAVTVYMERRAKIDLTKEEKYRELCVSIDALNSALAREEKIRYKKFLDREISKVVANSNGNIKAEDVKKDKPLIEKLKKTALASAKDEIKQLKKKKREEIVKEVEAAAYDGVERIVGEEIKKDLEARWKLLNKDSD